MGIWNEEDLVGAINLTPGPNNIAVIGYWVAEQHQNKGHATLAAQSLADFAQSEFKSVQAHALVANERSKRVLAKSGFVSMFTMYNDQGWFEVFMYTNPHRIIKSTQQLAQ